MQRIGVLNGNNITYDHDISGLVRGLTDGGVIQGGEISGGKVQPVQAVVSCQRSNGQKLMLYFESDEQVAIPSSGTFKVYIEVDQSKIDDGSGNAENGTGIASIKTGPSVPSQNSLLLAEVMDGAVVDRRNQIQKIQEIATRTTALENEITQQGVKVNKLEESGIPNSLGMLASVGERGNSKINVNIQSLNGQQGGGWIAGVAGGIFCNSGLHWYIENNSEREKKVLKCVKFNYFEIKVGSQGYYGGIQQKVIGPQVKLSFMAHGNFRIQRLGENSASQSTGEIGKEFEGNYWRMVEMVVDIPDGCVAGHFEIRPSSTTETFYIDVESLVFEDTSTEYFYQKRPEFQDCNLPIALGSDNGKMNVEIPFVCNGKPLRYFDIAAQKIGDPTYGLDCHFYEGVEDFANGITFWKRVGGLVAGSTVGPVSASKTYVRITPSSPIVRPRGTKMVAVVFLFGNAISSVNHYQLLCSDTMYSDCFGLLYKTQDNKRHKHQKVPFVYSDGIEMGCLSKHNDTYQTSPLQAEESVSNMSVTSNQTQGVELRFDKAGQYSISGRSAGYHGDTSNDGLVKIGGDICFKGNLYGNFNNATLIVRKPGVAKFYGGGGNYNYITWNINKRTHHVLTKRGDSYGRINKLSPLGSMVGFGLFSMDVNGILDGILDTSELHTSATTGHIGLGNCLGYLRIKGPNGQNLKFPVFGD